MERKVTLRPAALRISSSCLGTVVRGLTASLAISLEIAVMQ